MDNNSYLIPANSKKSMLILGFFNVTDLIIFGTGVVITFLMLMIIGTSGSLKQSLFIIAPAVIGAFLVLPVPNHHNIRTFIKNVIHYLVNQKKYYWRGWCIRHGEK